MKKATTLLLVICIMSSCRILNAINPIKSTTYKMNNFSKCATVDQRAFHYKMGTGEKFKVGGNKKVYQAR